MFTKTVKPLLVSGVAFFLLSCQSTERTMDAAAIASGTGESEKSHFSVTQTNSPKSFTDIGSALSWRDSQCVLHQTAFDCGAKVSDYYTGEKIAVRDAIYVSAFGIKTPGGYDLIAFEERKSAEKFLADNGRGKILTLDEVLDTVLE